MGDIFDVINVRDNKPAKKKFRSVKRYGIYLNGKWSRRLYERSKARRLVARATRMGGDCYMDSMMITIEVPQVKADD